MAVGLLFWSYLQFLRLMRLVRAASASRDQEVSRIHANPRAAYSFHLLIARFRRRTSFRFKTAVFDVQARPEEDTARIETSPV